MKTTMTIVLSLFCLQIATAQISIERPDLKNPVFDLINDSFLWKYQKKRNDLQFEIRVADDDGFNENLKVFKTKGSNGINKLTLDIPYLEAGESYFWDIRAIYKEKKSTDLTYDPWYSEDKLKGKPMKFSVSASAVDTNPTLSEGIVEEVDISGIFAALEEIAADPAVNETMPVVSKDRTKLAFVSDKNGALEVMQLDNIGEAGQTLAVKSRYKRDMLNPFWFPNEQLGFYSNYLEGKNYNVHRMLSGGAVSQVMQFDLAENNNRDWLFAVADTIYIPSTISYSDSLIGENAIVIYTHHADNEKAVLKLYNGYRDTEKDLLEGIMPDKHKRDVVYCNENSGNFDLWRFELKSKRTALSPSRPTQITSDESMEYEPAWSPNGKRIAYVSQQKGNSDIFIMDVRTGEDQAVQLTYHPMADRKPQWVDNETIIFQSNRVPGPNGELQWDIFMVSIPK